MQSFQRHQLRKPHTSLLVTVPVAFVLALPAPVSVHVCPALVPVLVEGLDKRNGD